MFRQTQSGMKKARRCGVFRREFKNLVLYEIHQRDVAKKDLKIDQVLF